MNHRLSSLLVALSLVGAQACAQVAPVSAPAKPKLSASEAFEKQDNGIFLKHHETFLARAKSGPIGLLFLGDSITERWKIAPDIWQANYGKYQPADFGIGGARTQNLIWQIEHGELDGLAPKVAVLMMGTNNSLEYNAEEIAAADRKIVAMVRAKLPQTKILVLGIFPRGPRDPKGGPINQAAIDDAAKRMVTINAVNRELAKLDDGTTIRFLDINAVFLGADGKIPDSIMPDQLHPGPAGYQLWADAMRPLLESMMGAPPAFTPQEQLSALFDVEGTAPYPSPYAGTLNFSAFTSRFDSGHGHGYRNELKVANKQRHTAAQTREHFASRVTFKLPDGAKTIIAQYHGEGLDTLVKVYVQDTADAKGIDGKANNGAFDLLVRILGTDGKEVTTALGALRSGEPFDLDIRFADGAATVAARTDKGGLVKTATTPVKADKRNIYFKFGDYLQALDLDTKAHTIVAAKWDAYYLQSHIDHSLITFSDTVFERGQAAP